MTMLILMFALGAAWAVEGQKSVLQKIVEGMNKNFPGEIAALGREIAKDFQQTFHEVAYGKPMHSPEAGTIFNPTPQLITEELKGKAVDGKTDQLTAEPTRTDEPQATIHGQSTLDKIKANVGNIYGSAEPAKEQQKEKDHGIEM
jgi:hypothetical protein